MAGPTAFKNSVNPLTWNVPIADSGGKPTPEFQQKWMQQATTNATIPDLTTAAKVSGVLDLLAATPGSLLARGASVWAGLAPSAAGKILKDNGAGAAPSWDTLSNIVDLIGNVQGDVLYRSAAGWSALAPGTAGQVLTSGGGAANPAWATPSSGGAASIQDNGTTLYIALSDADGQLVLDGAGDPIFVPEVLPAGAIPALGANPSVTASDVAVNGVATTYMRSDAAPAIQKATSAVFGLAKVDNVTIQAVAGLIGSKFCGFYVALTADQGVTNNVATTVLYNTVTLDTLGAYNAATGIYTPTKAGNWLFLWGMRASVATAMSLCQGKLWKGAANLQLINAPQLSGFATLSASIFAFTLTSMNGTTDSVHVEGLVQGTGGSDQFDGFGGVLNVFGGIYLGP